MCVCVYIYTHIYTYISMMMRMVINIDHLLRIMNNKYLSLIFSAVCLIYHYMKNSTPISISHYILYVFLFNSVIYITFTEKWLFKLQPFKPICIFRSTRITKRLCSKEPTVILRHQLTTTNSE